ncbi:FkbM family methyltransferase [Pedobacter sp. Du54]|uniref:FkbM family methyltransferase n=1 Tax=Pedobacter anseongensis TaxID=3133439 RepID=UPI0030A357F2
MNWKYLIGKYMNGIEEKLTRFDSSFVKKHFPFGRNWIFDLKRILNKDTINIIDVGANIGSVSKELSYYFPNSTIFAFEPINSTFTLLKDNTKLNNNIKSFHCALGSIKENMEILINKENTINSIKGQNYNPDNYSGSEEIKVIRLDEFAETENISRIGILKIDVEGFEFEVLEGCGNLLKGNIDCILLEVGYEREPTKVHFSDVEIYLEKYNFQLCGVYEIMRNLNDKRRISYSNNLYIKKDILLQNEQ